MAHAEPAALNRLGEATRAAVRTLMGIPDYEQASGLLRAGKEELAHPVDVASLKSALTDLHRTPDATLR